MKVFFCWLGGVVVGATLVGCGPTTQSQLTRCQNEKKTLLTRIVDEQKRAELLTSQNAQLASRLSDSEKQLARVYLQSTGRYAASPSTSAAPPPTVPPTSVTERPTRVIPLGSPTSSGPMLAPPVSQPRAARSRVERNDEPNELATGQPSLAAPGNGRSESGWLPKSVGPSRNAAQGHPTGESLDRPSGTPRR